jgi:hypothetical protein
VTGPLRVGFALYTVGPLACPRCGERVAGHDGFGVLRLTCQRRGRKHCRCSWVAVRLPPGTTATQLEHAFGRDVALAMAERWMQGGMLVVSADEPTYAQRAPDSPEPLMGWRRAAAILTSLMGATDG